MDDDLRALRARRTVARARRTVEQSRALREAMALKHQAAHGGQDVLASPSTSDAAHVCPALESTAERKPG